mgnify:CR=1 FL=1
MAQHPTLPVAQPAPPGLWVLHCDGSAIPNPGRMGLGATLLAPDGQQHSLSLTSSLVGCNNEAELRALMAALQALQALQARRLTIFTDSSILVEQLTPSLRPIKPIARLADLFDEARTMLTGFEHVQLRWIPRHRNTEADALAREALLQA